MGPVMNTVNQEMNSEWREANDRAQCRNWTAAKVVVVINKMGMMKVSREFATWMAERLNEGAEYDWTSPLGVKHLMAAFEAGRESR